MATSTTERDRAASHQADQALRAKQIEQAEELLFQGQQRLGLPRHYFGANFVATRCSRTQSSLKTNARLLKRRLRRSLNSRMPHRRRGHRS